MLLTNPPCFKPLVGCTDDFLGTSSLDGNTSGLSIDGQTLNGNGANIGIDFDALAARLKEYGSGSMLQNNAKSYLAQYVITAKNTGKNALSGVKIQHGPLPFGAFFKQAGSDPRCLLSQKSVLCTANLQSGETSSFSLSYETTSAFTCQFARLLEKAKVTYENVISGTVPSVMTTVTCTTKAVPRTGSLFDSMTQKRTNETENTSEVFVGEGGQTPSSESFSEKMMIQETIFPETGADNMLFIQSVEASDFTKMTPSSDGFTIASLGDVLIVLIGIFSLVYAIKIRKQSR